MESYGKIAYEAYREAVNGKSPVTGDVLPQYADLHFEVSEAWEIAAQAVVSVVSQAAE